MKYINSILKDTITIVLCCFLLSILTFKKFKQSNKKIKRSNYIVQQQASSGLINILNGNRK